MRSRFWSKSTLTALLWTIPVGLFVNDSLCTLSLVKDDGMLPLMRRGDVVLVDRRSRSMGGPENKVNNIVLLRNPEAGRGESQLRLIRRIAQHPLQRGGEVVLKKDNLAAAIEGEEARDSKQFGPVPEALILGQVVAVVFPPWRASFV